MIRALAAAQPGSPLQPFEFDPGPLKPDQVEIEVHSCGICHSDLSMIENHWHMTQYPFVPGHEIVGSVAAVGTSVANLSIGQKVGLGWYSRSCLTCRTCMSGDHNLCPSAEGTITHQRGGFAQRVRAQAAWATPIPDAIDLASAGPLFCGGITVFNPIVQFNVRPTSRVGVIGIGGLGHLAIKFLRAWGCEVLAFSSNPAKEQEVLQMGAHRVVNSRDADALKKIAGSLDFILSTVNVPLNWDAYFACLAPRGRLHTVGAVTEPIPAPAFPMIIGQLQLSASPLGSPATTALMLDFCARHNIAPIIETFPMSKANDALQHLRDGKARYRIVLTNDLR